MTGLEFILKIALDINHKYLYFSHSVLVATVTFLTTERYFRTGCKIIRHHGSFRSAELKNSRVLAMLKITKAENSSVRCV